MKYGITDHNLDHYDARHLVWNHPSIKPEKLTHYMNQGLLALNNSARVHNMGFQWLKLCSKSGKLSSEQSLSLGIRKFYQTKRMNPTANYLLKASYEIDDALPVRQGRFSAVEENTTIEAIENRISRISFQSLFDILAELDEQFALDMISRHGAINVLDLFSLCNLEQIKELSRYHQKVMLECEIEKLLKLIKFAGIEKVFAIAKKTIAQMGEDKFIRQVNSTGERTFFAYVNRFVF